MAGNSVHCGEQGQAALTVTVSHRHPGLSERQTLGIRGLSGSRNTKPRVPTKPGSEELGASERRRQEEKDSQRPGEAETPGTGTERPGTG